MALTAERDAVVHEGADDIAAALDEADTEPVGSERSTSMPMLAGAGIDLELVEHAGFLERLDGTLEGLLRAVVHLDVAALGVVREDHRALDLAVDQALGERLAVELGGCGVLAGVRDVGRS